MSDSIKYTVYPSVKKQSATLLMIVLGAVVLTGVLGFIYLRKASPSPTEISTPTVAPLVPNPTPIPNPH
jgi:hypothetical protein